MLKKTKRKPIHSELYQSILKKLRGLYLYAQFCRRYRETFFFRVRIYSIPEHPKQKEKNTFWQQKTVGFSICKKVWFQSANKTIFYPSQTKIFLTNNRSFEKFHTNVSYSFYKLPFVCLLFHVKHRFLHIFHFF